MEEFTDLILFRRIGLIGCRVFLFIILDDFFFFFWYFLRRVLQCRWTCVYVDLEMCDGIGIG